MNCSNNKIEALSNSLEFKQQCDFNELSDTESERFYNMMISKGSPSGQQHGKTPALLCSNLFIEETLEKNCADKPQSISEEQEEVRELLAQLENIIIEGEQIEDIIWPEISNMEEQDQSQMEQSSGWNSSRSTVRTDSDEQRQKSMIKKYFERNGLKVKRDLVLRKELQDQQCPICYDDLITGGYEENDREEDKEIAAKTDLEQQHSLVKLYCQHYFHDHCIKKWLVLNPKCPVCRRQYNDNPNENLQGSCSDRFSQDIYRDFQQPSMMQNFFQMRFFERPSSIIHEVELISTLPKVQKLRKFSM